MSHNPKPLFIIVGGSPASGKSTLAEWLAEEFNLPLISRDAFKEALMDALGSPDADTSHQLGNGAYAVLSVIQRQLLEAGVGMVIESNFVKGRSEEDLKPAIERSRAVAIYCEASIDESRRRFNQRAHRGDRHPGHHDHEPGKLEELIESIEAGDYDPLELDIPYLKVDTTNPDTLDRAGIAEFVRDATRT